MISEKVLKELARIGYDALLQGKEGKIRPKLGNKVDLSALQVYVVGTLALSNTMGPVVFESARKYAKYLSAEGLSLIRKMPDYHGFAESETLEEARTSAEFVLLQKSYESTGTGLLTLTEFQRNKLVAFQVDECVSCYGIANIGKPICYYTGGALAGFVESVFARDASFVESKCHANGDPCCEFVYTVSDREKAREFRTDL